LAARFLTVGDRSFQRPDVVVVGSGIVGLATAFFAGKAGLRVLVVERMVSPASLTSRRSGEGVRAQWSLPHNIAIARAAIELYGRFGEVLGDERLESGLRQVGYLYASRTEAGAALLADRVTLQRGAGLSDVDYLEASELRDRFPLLARDVRGGAFRAKDGIVSVERIISGYLARMTAEIALDTHVEAITAGPAGAMVRTQHGSIACGMVVVAAGAAAHRLLAGFAAAPPMRTARSSIIYVKVDGIPADHPATIDIDEGSFWRPDCGGARITASFRGLRFVADGVDEPAPEADYLARAIGSVSPMTPIWAALAPCIRDNHVRAGTFAVTADGAPVIGPLPGADRIFVNAGYGGHGVMMSSEGARRLAELLAGSKAHDPAGPFACERFHDGRPLMPEPMTLNLAEQAMARPEEPA
jgi:sarcosine oxidase, subunit beta